MGSVAIGEQPDEAELLEELEELQQQDLDDKMRNTVPVPVLPTVANGESELTFAGRRATRQHVVLTAFSQREGVCRGRRRRGSGAQKASGRDGYVSWVTWQKTTLLQYCIAR